MGASLPLAAHVVESFFTKLEAGQETPGTVAQRVLCRNDTLRQNGVRVEGPDHESTLAWSLGIGVLAQPKRFFYGLTLQELFTLARKNQ